MKDLLMRSGLFNPICSSLCCLFSAKKPDKEQLSEILSLYRHLLDKNATTAAARDSNHVFKVPTKPGSREPHCFCFVFTLLELLLLFSAKIRWAQEPENAEKKLT
ncbi:hypothetical protein XENOCAPTIV_015252 [Xenoophorus captivus]|uniref:Uncharacterized protein n=1 Tax=Xenoophorus captivus TaxID=1517983 RepID=A0ABV0R0J2_9TELE